VSWIPGWDSVAGAGWWSGFYFWASIIALIGLGKAEVASHRYSDRKDELAAVEQEAIQRRHDEDMARVQHDTAQANERAAQLTQEASRLSAEAEAARAAIADANARAAEATQKAAEAQLALERFRAPRQLTPQQQAELRDKMAPFAGTVVRIWTLPAGADISPFSEAIAHVLSDAKRVVGGATSLSGRSFPGVIAAFRTGSNAGPQARILVEYLDSIGISAAMAQPFDNEDGLMPASNMYTPPGAGDPNVVIVIGSKQ
jgi:hypothetical protein